MLTGTELGCAGNGMAYAIFDEGYSTFVGTSWDEGYGGWAGGGGYGLGAERLHVAGCRAG